MHLRVAQGVFRRYDEVLGVAQGVFWDRNGSSCAEKWTSDSSVSPCPAPFAKALVFVRRAAAEEGAAAAAGTDAEPLVLVAELGRAHRGARSVRRVNACRPRRRVAENANSDYLLDVEWTKRNTTPGVLIPT